MRRVRFLNRSKQRATVELHLEEVGSTLSRRLGVAARPGCSRTRALHPRIPNLVEVLVRPMSRITVANGTVLHIRHPMHAPTGEEFDEAIVTLEGSARGLVCGITDRGTVLTEEFV
ncbi:MAG: hypothetical protein ACYTF8_06915 [Planctomycetota bacterium]|jgi:hypothetical protein